jgi:hypothetical protein
VRLAPEPCKQRYWWLAGPDCQLQCRHPHMRPECGLHHSKCSCSQASAVSLDGAIASRAATRHVQLCAGLMVDATCVSSKFERMLMNFVWPGCLWPEVPWRLGSVGCVGHDGNDRCCWLSLSCSVRCACFPSLPDRNRRLGGLLSMCDWGGACVGRSRYCPSELFPGWQAVGLHQAGTLNG